MQELVLVLMTKAEAELVRDLTAHVSGSVTLSRRKQADSLNTELTRVLGEGNFSDLTGVVHADGQMPEVEDEDEIVALFIEDEDNVECSGCMGGCEDCEVPVVTPAADCGAIHPLNGKVCAKPAGHEGTHSARVRFEVR
jgi:hypothetical protein